MSTKVILENYLAVKQQVYSAAVRVHRDPASIKIIVVSKGQGLAQIQQAYEAGARIFGENYAEEGVEKIQAMQDTPGIEWHMIGHVQSRKALLVSRYFDYLHSLDSRKLAGRLDAICSESNRRLPVLLECNVSGERSKFGLPAWKESGWKDLVLAVEPLLAFANIQVRGLMTMAPFSSDPEDARPYFRRLRQLSQYLARQLPEAGWEELSMGMSGDYQVAVEEGATMVRIGTAILGPRPS